MRTPPFNYPHSRYRLIGNTPTFHQDASKIVWYWKGKLQGDNNNFNNFFFSQLSICKLLQLFYSIVSTNWRNIFFGIRSTKNLIIKTLPSSCIIHYFHSGCNKQNANGYTYSINLGFFLNLLLK